MFSELAKKLRERACVLGQGLFKLHKNKFTCETACEGVDRAINYIFQYFTPVQIIFFYVSHESTEFMNLILCPIITHIIYNNSIYNYIAKRTMRKIEIQKI